VVTATNRFGSTTVTTSNFYYDEAGLPVEFRKDLRPFVNGPAQLRAWYGLGPGQDGAGQTIVITAFWRTRGLRTAVDRFSSKYGLPLVCGTAHAGGNCFKLRDLTFRRQPKYVVPGEDEDIEWAHAITSKARIVVLRARSIPALLYAAGRAWRTTSTCATSCLRSACPR
jgi:hypothetical protein